MFKVLVFAMLSSASGWGLPNDPLLESNDSTSTDGVDDARDRRQLCSCDRRCNRGCDGGIWGSGGCDTSCDAGCDGRRLAAGCQEQYATASGLSRCPRLSSPLTALA